MISDSDLLSFARRGLIPGPQEDEETFLLRASKAPPLDSQEWKEAGEITQPLFGFSVDWVHSFYSNQKLPFWEGAATWIDHNIPTVQLRTGFKKGAYLGYSRTEILAHEAIHAARCAFEEPRFEEILAYQTSQSRFRRWLGPLFRTSWDPLLFLLFFPYGLFLLYRLWRDYRAFLRCHRTFPLSTMVCMTDQEIARASIDKNTLRSRIIEKQI